MENIIIDFKEKPDLDNPILIEGLPGVGNVGKLAAEHIIDVIGAVEFASIYSKFFPPQVLIDDEGVARLVSNKLYYSKAKTGDHSDIIFLIGDYQGLTPEGQYELSSVMLDMLVDFGGKRVFTLGGWGIGRVVDKPRILGAATHTHLVEEMKKHGIVFSKDEPGNGIVGASGLLLGLGSLRGLEGVCLMGETSGYFIDPGGAKAIVEVLASILKRDISMTDLEEKTKEMETVTAKLKELDEMPEPNKDDLRYIG
ncbi:MAG: proteasome assembly chaperone family protein [Thermoplasmata archaeon]|nr:proteasome assembly chaperone family protein [Thermoplasmata archaeon]